MTRSEVVARLGEATGWSSFIDLPALPLRRRLVGRDACGTAHVSAIALMPRRRLR